MSVANNRGVFQTSFIELYHGGDFLQVCRTQHLEQPLINQPGPLNELKVVLRQFHVITIVIVSILRNNSNNNCQLRRNGFEGQFKLQQRTCRLFCQREKHKCCIWMGWARGGSRTGRSSPPKLAKVSFSQWICTIRKTALAIQGHFAVHCFVTTVLWSILHLSYSCEAVMNGLNVNNSEI